MPIYEYRCQSCGKTTSVFVRSISVSAEPRCQHCGADALERLMSGFAFPRTGAADIGIGPDDASFGGTGGDDWGEDDEGLGDEGLDLDDDF